MRLITLALVLVLTSAERPDDEDDHQTSRQHQLHKQPQGVSMQRADTTQGGYIMRKPKHESHAQKTELHLGSNNEQTLLEQNAVHASKEPPHSVIKHPTDEWEYLHDLTEPSTLRSLLLWTFRLAFGAVAIYILAQKIAEKAKLANMALKLGYGTPGGGSISCNQHVAEGSTTESTNVPSQVLDEDKGSTIESTNMPSRLLDKDQSSIIDTEALPSEGSSEADVASPRGSIALVQADAEVMPPMSSDHAEAVKELRWQNAGDVYYC
jgi:hypothetical protein